MYLLDCGYTTVGAGKIPETISLSQYPFSFID